nr:AAA family ATPase [uncultured Prevotella sp.]
MATFILTDEFKKILEKQDVIDALAKKGYNSIDDFTREILSRLNQFDKNLNLSSIAYHTLQDTDTYIGVILDEFLNKQYNVCIIPPKLGTRSGFLSQQIFGFISNLINGQQTSESYTICDKPVIIVNCMVDSLANSAICNIIGSNIIGFKYIDIFNRKEDFGTPISNLSDFVNTVSQYKKTISQDIELQDDTLILRTERLKDFSTSLTNEPYYFAINAYPAVMLAKKEGYKIESSDFETKLAAGKSNKNIQAFVRFLKGLKAANFPQRSKIIIDPLQRIYYGAPGTGKSNEIKLMTGNGTFSKNYTFRTTFHPDSDYSSFVGTYKPIWNGEKIIYVFRPQSFLRAYIEAWKHPEHNVALVIEEINRGNCAQIFGDIFQLLDRERTGLSKYPIEADIDMQNYLKGEFANIDSIYNEDQIEDIDKYYANHYDTAFEDIKNGIILTLPKNLSLLATMNTSDQSLFPMDSAFKRRWEWQYMPIVEGVIEKGVKLNWKIKLDNKYKYIDWWQFLKRINAIISDLTTSEDKQLGYFFCQPNDFVNSNHEADEKEDLITAKYFVDKVIFYLWNDVFKDYAFDAKCCKSSDDKEVLFAEFYNEDGKTINVKTLKYFFETLVKEGESSLVEEIVTPSITTPVVEPAPNNTESDGINSSTQ